MQVRHLTEAIVHEASTPRHTSTTNHTLSSRVQCGPTPASPTRPRRPTRHKPPPQVQVLTQNVQGLLKNRVHLENWFDAFRRRYDRRHFDVVVLQETRATERWSPILEDMYARAWGYDSAKLANPLSYWPATESAAGGVAILFHPQSAISDVRPWRQELWSAHFAAVQGRLDGEVITLACIYGSIHPTTRDSHFRQLAELQRPEGTILLGGDFNCTLDPELDRSRRTNGQQLTDGLSQLLVAWDLLDAASDAMQAVKTMNDVLDFRATHHTYVYSLRDNMLATARLDRWYLSASAYNRIRRLATTAPFCRSDHDGVILQLQTAEPPQTRKGKQPPRLRYPLPECARDAVNAIGKGVVERFAAELEDHTAAQLALGWDAAKTEIRRDSLVAQRHQLTRATRRQRHQLKRLTSALKEARRAANSRSRSIGATVDAITAAMTTLALDPTARYRSIRREIIRVQNQRLLRTRRARNASHAGRSHESVKAFYRRISVKIQRRTMCGLPRLTHSNLSNADRVGQDWVPIIQRPPCDQLAQDRVFETLPPKPQTLGDQFDELLFTTEAVVKAIKSCPRGKASGPDGIPNDWYRDHIDTVAPLLATLFATWYKANVLPPSFKTASVCCIPKKSQPQTGLDFRPIALLNTDYKIYATVLLHRIRAVVPDLVSSTQYGFVKGRQVHDAIDVWSALQKRAASQQLQPSALAVMLDFAKAYDSLDRNFLTRALRRHGLPTPMIDAIEHMHLGTTAAFVVDGQVSMTLDVTTGIRQGCPLAPTLFVLAVDVLYDLVRAFPDISGLAVSDSVTVSIVGFADDTSVYLRSPAELPALQDLLDTFGAASGLKVNVDKSTAIFLSPRGWHADIDMHGFPVAATDQLVRYLGGQISTEPVGSHIWEITLQQLRSRLHLAAIKTTDILQRVQVCQAVILPKILFVARHSWPTAHIVDMLQEFVHTYAWHGLLTPRTNSARRAWMGESTASTAREHGGLQLPSIREELLLLSAATLQRWHSAKDLVAAAVGAVLAATSASPTATHITPGREPAHEPRLATTIAITGRAVLRSAATFPWVEEERAAVLSLLPLAGRASSRDGRWLNGWYQRDYHSVKKKLNEIRAVQRSRAGRLNLHALLHTRVLGSDLLLHASGRPLRASDLSGLRAGEATVQDLLEMHWVNRTTINFRLRDVSYPYDAVDSFRFLCDALVFSYPDLLTPHDPDHHLVEQGNSKDVWSLLLTPTATKLLRLDENNDTSEVGQVSSLHHAETMARSVSKRHTLQFAPHPALSSVLPLWGTSRLHAKSTLRTLISKTTRARATRDLERRRGQAHASAVEFGTALDLVSWTEVHRLQHTSSRQRLMYFRVKGQRLSGWDRLHERRGCPHCASAGSSGGTVHHIVWECAAAKSLWATIRAIYASLGLWTMPTTDSNLEFLTAVFSLRLPRVPPKIWDLPSLRKCLQDDEDTGAGPFPVLQAVWQQLVLETLVVLNAWRNNRPDETRAWTRNQAAATHRISCQRVLDTLLYRLERQPDPPPHAAGIIAKFSSLLDDAGDPSDYLPVMVAPARLLFFDGGSRGNPGPGGAGAVIVDVSTAHPTAAILWSSATNLPDPLTTNNRAEYRGLIDGLQAAVQNDWRDISVIGDSALLIRQMRENRPPRNAQLRQLYTTARRLADLVGVRQWHHHVRAHNTMADALANHAMDTSTASHVHHPTDRPCHTDLPQLVASDLQPWLICQVDPR